MGCHNARTTLLDWVSRDRQAALRYSLISPLTVVRRLIGAVMSLASPGFQGVVMTANVPYFREPLPDIGPCELAVTTALRSFCHIDPATLAESGLDFTDPNGNAWKSFGSGKQVRNTSYKGPGVWSPYAVLEPLPGCSPG